MTDLITKARKEWCEVHDPEGWSHTNVCPTYVVAALLDVLRLVCPPDQPCFECSGVDGSHTEDCTSGKAEAAITRALEEK